MNQEIEIEYKNLLDENEYSRLKDTFFTRDTPFSQTNHYFDTEDFLLKEHGSMLRIREKNSGYVLTLKQPHEKGLLETHQNLSENEADAAFNGSGIPEGDVLHHLNKSLNVEGRFLTYLGSLTTKRLETEMDEGLLVLDESTYLGVTDYELEFESSDEDRGRKAFQQLLREFSIKERHTMSKSHRFFNRSRNN
ncbi:CYTH domain-containing protein [Alteribacter natronophilus]|nr:CYTH domain-containing protein [Alteribacter natronophilus]TMW74048.1 CYTH domain-containing protein [Alteribacter natronophilus]